VLLASAVFLYLQAFILPNVPRIANGDQGIHLSLAARMFEGQLIYRDFDHFPLPGTDVLYLSLFKLFGVRAWIAPAMLILIGVVVTWLSIEISTKLMSGAGTLVSDTSLHRFFRRNPSLVGHAFRDCSASGCY
jgi:hypothetical protein